MTIPATPKVRAFAQRNGINLTDVRGTGAGGRITLNDVRARAPRPRPLATMPAGVTQAVVSVVDPHATVEVDPWAANPVLDEAKILRPQMVRKALTKSPAPTMFVSGDLPAYITSGADVTLLNRLPWPARCVAARASQDELATMLEEFGDRDTGYQVARMMLTDDSINDYVRRVLNWLNTGAAWA